MFTHLHVHSPYSFLDGASPIPKLVQRAAELGYDALALTDHNSVSGAGEFQRHCALNGLQAIQGAEVTMTDGSHLILLACGPDGYQHICHLLTQAHLTRPREKPGLSYQTLLERTAGLICLSGCHRGRIPTLLRQQRRAEARQLAQRLAQAFGRENFYLELQGTMLPGDRALNAALAELGAELGIPLVATGNVHYSTAEEFPFYDLLTCVRTGTTVEHVHPERPVNGQNYLKPPLEMAKIFSSYPTALANTRRIAAACRPALDPHAQYFPVFPVPTGSTPALLRRLTYSGARERYYSLRPQVTERLEHELAIIQQLGYADYFLVVWDLVRYARQRGILCTGRGSVADSAVAYCLGITEVDPIARRLLFERFLSLERCQKPDIDLDFDYRYRDRVAAYVRERYGKERVAAVCTFYTYHVRSALRDFGQALGFERPEIDRLAKLFPPVPADGITAALQRFPEIKQAGLPLERYRQLLAFCQAAAGLPRHMGTHPSGLVIANRPLAGLAPLQKTAKGTVMIALDKNQVEECGLLKLDLLSLRALGAMDDTLRLLAHRLRYQDIPADDPATYRLLRSGDTVGIFQLESSAQRILQARLEVNCFEDLVASVALIRPGPIKGQLVEPYIARRRGREKITYPHPSLAPILAKSYGLVLFQEQVLEVAVQVAAFSAGEADQLRRLMTDRRPQAELDAIGTLFVERALANGMARQQAQEIFAILANYASYGFCEAHAASFADLAYRTAYLVCHYPAEYFTALLNNYPMGYYPLQTICGQARRRGIAVYGPDVNHSTVDFSLTEGGIRCSLARVAGVGERNARRIVAARAQKPFTSLADFYHRLPLARDLMENLVLGGAFDSLHPNRRQTFWRLHNPERQERSSLPDFTLAEKIQQEYRLLGFSYSGHPLQACGERPAGLYTAATLRTLLHGSQVAMAGLVVRPHRPPTRSGRTAVFLSLEDETGLVDVVVPEEVYHQYAYTIMHHPFLTITGRLERRGRAVQLLAQQVADILPQ